MSNNNFEKILRETVTENRRVIIPDLGAFISDSVENTIVFSTLLKYNDGLLAGKLRASGIDNPELATGKFVSGIVNTLERGEVFNIKGLGYFYREEENLQFKFDRTNGEKESSENVKKSLNKKLAIAFFISATIFMLMFFMYRFFMPASNADALANIQPDNRFTVIDKTYENDSLTVFYGTEPALTAGKQTCCVVAACFEKKINAEKFVVQCINEGYTDAAVLPPIGNLFPVAVAFSTSYSEAMKLKKEYDGKFSENTWIYATK
ncbi:MAG: hypothetical protein LBG92_09890 [Prevotellaceae bacterium]|nr:hypothetical protein [Prevotellaceae bacterium]